MLISEIFLLLRSLDLCFLYHVKLASAVNLIVNLFVLSSYELHLFYIRILSRIPS